MVAQTGEGFSGGEFEATVLRMGRSDVAVRIGAHHAVEREPLRPVHLLAGITANERMDWLVEKAAELGAASITPLVAERSVLKLKGERAEKKLAHWQAVAVSACEQCTRNRVPPLHAPTDLQDWLEGGAKQLPPGAMAWPGGLSTTPSPQAAEVSTPELWLRNSSRPPPSL